MILSQRNLWSGGLVKDRENRYKENFWRNTGLNYIQKYSIEEVQEKLKKKDNVEIKSDFFWSEELGPLTNFHGKPPLRMLIDNERVLTSSRFKKFLYVFLQEMIYASWYEKLGILLSIRRLKNIYFESVYRGVSEYLIDPKYITPPVKEIRRCLEIAMPGSGKFEWEGYYSDPICFFLEYDPAYRYRLQDILTLVRKNEFVNEGGKVMGVVRMLLWLIFKNDRFLYRTTREVKRLVSILIKRENGVLNWGKLPIISVIAVQCSPYCRNKLNIFMNELDINKVKLNQFDRYWSYHNPEYDYDGLSKEIRDKIVKDYDDGKIK